MNESQDKALIPGAKISFKIETIVNPTMVGKVATSPKYLLIELDEEGNEKRKLGVYQTNEKANEYAAYHTKQYADQIFQI